MTMITQLLNSPPTLLGIMVCNVLSVVILFSLCKLCKWIGCVLNRMYRKWKWGRGRKKSVAISNPEEFEGNTESNSNDNWIKFEAIQERRDEDDYFLENF